MAESRGRWRTPVAALLIVLGCVLAPPAVVAVWSSNQIANTDRYVENVAPLATTPSVQAAIAKRTTQAIMQRLDVKDLLSDAGSALPPRLDGLVTGLTGPIADQVSGFVEDKALQVVQSPAFKTIWTDANRAVHKQLDAVLSGRDSKLLQSEGGAVSVDLGPVVDLVKQRLVAAGLSVASNIPEIHPTFALFKSEDLAKAQRGYKALNVLKWVLPFAALLLLAVGVYLARNRRRALAGVGLGLAAAMVVLGAGLMIGRYIYLDQVAANGLNTTAAQDIFDTLVRFLRNGLRMVLVLGLVVAAAAYLTGPSSTAVRTRAAVSSGLARLRGDRGSTWVADNRTALRVAIVALGAVVFVFWNHPTGTVVLVLTVLVLLGLALVELLGRAAHG
jgi:hypothetical protein